MPPRKSNVSTTSNGPDDGADVTPARSSKEGTSIEDLTLPKSMIARLAKGVLPANTQIHKDALLALHKSATVFVSYIAANSSENAQASGKKTIMPPDVIAALKDAEFDGFLPRLEAELKKYNEVQCDKRNTYRRKVKEEKAAAAAAASGGEQQSPETRKDSEKAGVTAEQPSVDGTTNGHIDSDEMDRPIKKLKGDDGQAMIHDPDDMEDVDETFEQEPDEHEEDEGDEDEDDDAAVSDEEAADYDASRDEQMEDALEEREGRGELQDEALDEPYSD